MFKKGTLLYSIFKNKCPKCNEGNFFRENNLLHLKNILKMNTYCSHCGFKFEIEPSFFYGAMYISYGLTVAIGIITFVILFQFNLTFLEIFIGIILVLFLFMPITLRLSRLIYSNIFSGYDPKYRNEEGILEQQKESSNS